ncbi:molybdopterin-binding protein [Paenibacillus sp. CGMCC 1.16610]|uniref:Molybdopterin molybdenumtransferase n=1 Tax=Paenibacillus anseongense TaxID=2682845 RepID=A0ABW9U2A0_9BACL|nr:MULTISPECIES: molybdopterin-binding protein [Paenibacillus]MBA2943174.1 molybdopterin-binding protein [Paenibacillus sp. CGMCC 1.16610]MVQ33671.1 molybdopterin-binding protein [Paenibacillus anseongense]
MSRQESMLREVKVEDAVGMILPHDLTQILPGEFKGRLFRKGHQVTEADIPALLSIGKEHIYMMELQPGYLHEDEAAQRMARAIAGDELILTEPHEGKVNVKSPIRGLVRIDKAFVDSVNTIDEVVMSTIRSGVVVEAGASLVGTRVIPLIVDEAKVVEVERIAAARRAEGFTLLEVKPFRKLRVGVVTTGSEVFKGRIQDKFGPVVKEKVAQLGSEVVDQRFALDDSEAIVGEIHALLAQNVDLVLVTGGMSVDPDDRTPGAIKQAGARVVSYGTPMLPGSMLMIAYLGDVPIMGLPGCVMHDPYTSFDVLLPRICAGETIVRSDITEMGYGGFYQC